VLGHIEALGHLVVPELLEESQTEHLAMLRLEVVERSTRDDLVVGAEHDLFGE
jgi:hypothetical protein